MSAAITHMHDHDKLPDLEEPLPYALNPEIDENLFAVRSNMIATLQPVKGSVFHLYGPDGLLSSSTPDVQRGTLRYMDENGKMSSTGISVMLVRNSSNINGIFNVEVFTDEPIKANVSIKIRDLKITGCQKKEDDIRMSANISSSVKRSVQGSGIMSAIFNAVLSETDLISGVISNSKKAEELQQNARLPYVVMAHSNFALARKGFITVHDEGHAYCSYRIKSMSVRTIVELAVAYEQENEDMERKKNIAGELKTALLSINEKDLSTEFPKVLDFLESTLSDLETKIPNLYASS